MASEQTIKHPGPPTGLHDSNGRMIHVGEEVRMTIIGGADFVFHGNWIIFRIDTRGMIPVLRYQRSENGQLLPHGFIESLLTDHYKGPLLQLATKLDALRPVTHKIEVTEPTNAQA